MNGRQARGRTIDLDLIAIRHLMQHEQQSGYLFVLPIGKWKKFSGPPEESV